MANDTVQTLMRAGLSKSFAYHVVNDKRSIGVPLALWLHENDGLKVGPLADKSDAEIKLLRGMYEPQAPASVLNRRQTRATANDAATTTAEAA